MTAQRTRSPSFRIEGARKAAALTAELIRGCGAAAPIVAAKAVIARSFWGVDVTRFLMLEMYDQRMDRWSDSMSYLNDIEPGLRTINWRGGGKRLTVDKLATAERFARAQIPSPRIVSVIGRDARAHPHDHLFPVCSGVDELTPTLASAPDRLFVKPATGWRGDGALGPERRDGAWKVQGMTLSDRELAERLLSAAPPAGLLMQARLRSHPSLAPIGGELGLGCVRINTALTVDGPEVLFAFAKLMGAPGLVDNFAGGKYGNLAAGVDIASGRLARVFGRKSGQRWLIDAVTTHPVTNAPLIGFQLPLWSEAVNLARHVAASFPETPLVGADVAITEEGLKVIEIQSDWESNVSQLTMGAGLRPVLRDVVPRLALDEEVKHRAMRQMGLTGARRRAKLQRAPRA